MNTRVLAALAVLIAGCATPPAPSKAPLELQAIQTREFETDKRTAFAATLSVFQDLGYVVSAASIDTGLINAKSPTRQELKPSFLSPFYIAPVMTDTKATAFVEEIAPKRTKVRLNFVASKAMTTMYGRSENDTPIEEPAPYQDAFLRIQQGIFLRTNVQ